MLRLVVINGIQSSRFTLTKKALDHTLHFPPRKLLFLASSQKGLETPYETPYICA